MAVAVVAVGVTLDARAWAETCAPPDLLETIPRTDAMVPANASFMARYDSTAEYVNEDVVLVPNGGSEEVVKVVFDKSQGLLTFKPDGELPPGLYKLRWPKLRSLNTATPGKGAEVTFTVTDVQDVAPPMFEGLTAVRWDFERAQNDCTDSLVNRLVFDFDLAPADDDGGRDGLTLVVFQTKGGLVDAGSVPVLTSAMPEVGKGAQVKLAVEDSTGDVCFAALARDLTDKTSNGGSHEVCIHTTAPPFFRGCAVAPGAERGVASGQGVALVVGAVLLARARRRRRLP